MLMKLCGQRESFGQRTLLSRLIGDGRHNCEGHAHGEETRHHFRPGEHHREADAKIVPMKNNALSPISKGVVDSIYYLVTLPPRICLPSKV